MATGSSNRKSSGMPSPDKPSPDKASPDKASAADRNDAGECNWEDDDDDTDEWSLWAAGPGETSIMMSSDCDEGDVIVVNLLSLQ